MKIEIVLAGWFFISTYGKDETHNYLLEDKKNNTYVALSIDKELPYPVGSWGKFKLDVECDVVQTIEQTSTGYQFAVSSKFCNANKYEILKCRRPFIVGGVTYCE